MDYKCLKVIAKEHDNWNLIINHTDHNDYFQLLMNSVITKNFTKLILKEIDHDKSCVIEKYAMEIISNPTIIREAGDLTSNNKNEFLSVFNKMIMRLDILFITQECLDSIIQVMDIISCNPNEAITFLIFLINTKITDIDEIREPAEELYEEIVDDYEEEEYIHNDNFAIIEKFFSKEE